MSKLKAAFTCYTEQELGQQINFLKANLIEEKPTVRSVQLVGNFSFEAQAFLEKGGLGGNAIVDPQQKGISMVCGHGICGKQVSR